MSYASADPAVSQSHTQGSVERKLEELPGKSVSPSQSNENVSTSVHDKDHTVEANIQTTSTAPCIKETGVKPATSDDVTCNLSRRAKRRILRKEQERVRIQAQKLAKRQNKSTSPAKQLGSVHNDYLDETGYYFENGLRKVYPYYFTFSTHAKGRWCGRSLLEVFTEEFGASKLGNVPEMIESGRMIVNGQVKSVDYVIKQNDYIQNTLHRHEVPVTAERIEIIEETTDILVVSKPSSIPIHPCGNYRHNSLTFILAKDYGYQNLRPIHRLDRLTSGVCIFCKTEAKNLELHEHMQKRQVQKEYICRVEGKFPEEVIECKEPIDVFSHKLGLHKVGTNGKVAHTTFQRLSCHGNTSVVKCQPHTGRTHQIRVHLQYLGYPIVNDSLYNGEVWGPQKGKGGQYGKSEEQFIEELFVLHHLSKYQLDEDSVTQGGKHSRGPQSVAKITSSDTPSQACTSPQATNRTSSSQSVDDREVPPCKRLKEDDTVEHRTTPQKSNDADDGSCVKVKDTQVTTGSDHPRPAFDQSKLTVEPTCIDCQKKYLNPNPEELIMYLHAYRYKGPTWEYSTSLPSWAEADWEVT